MARPRRVDPKVVARAQAAVTEATSVDELRCAQAVLLPALLGATLAQTAVLLGVGRATVPRLQARRGRRGQAKSAAPRGWGGRRRGTLSIEEEKKFLAPWLQKAKTGGVLVASPLRAAWTT